MELCHLAMEKSLKSHGILSPKFYGNPDFGDPQYSFAVIRWCTRLFCMYIMSQHLDGVHCDVFSLGVHLLVSLLPFQTVLCMHTKLVYSGPL